MKVNQQYKLLITSSLSYSAVHTIVEEFNTMEQADIAHRIINERMNKDAIKLYSAETIDINKSYMV